MIVALLAAAQAVRSAVVAKYGATEPHKAGIVWPSHPTVKLNEALAAIATSAAQGEPPPPQWVEQGIAVSRKAPLEAGPFLLRGAEAKVDGDDATAERAFLEARRRNPRNRAARYFLAEHYLGAGETAQGLQELTVLTRLVRDGDISPFLATFARTPGAVPTLRQLFATQPQLEARVLARLSVDPANAELIEAIASPRAYEGQQGRGWLANFLSALIQNGHYGRAYQMWQRATGVGHRPLIFDPQFDNDPALPPFGWSFLSSAAGLAEPTGEGSLRIIFFGRDDAVIASQLLLLEPGNYAFSTRVDGSGEAGSTVSWVLSCLPSGQRLFELPLGTGRPQPLRAGFQVDGSTCQAQRLDLLGTAPEFPQQVDLVISNLQLSRVGR